MGEEKDKIECEEKERIEEKQKKGLAQTPQPRNQVQDRKRDQEKMRCPECNLVLLKGSKMEVCPSCGWVRWDRM